jgi:hypothetical protein
MAYNDSGSSSRPSDLRRSADFSETLHYSTMSTVRSGTDLVRDRSEVPPPGPDTGVSCREGDGWTIADAGLVRGLSFERRM